MRRPPGRCVHQLSSGSTRARSKGLVELVPSRLGSAERGRGCAREGGCTAWCRGEEQAAHDLVAGLEAPILQYFGHLDRPDRPRGRDRRWRRRRRLRRHGARRKPARRADSSTCASSPVRLSKGCAARRAIHLLLATGRAVRCGIDYELCQELTWGEGGLTCRVTTETTNAALLGFGAVGWVEFGELLGRARVCFDGVHSAIQFRACGRYR